jgi:ribonuclease BN (tRNA processing enzyme)
VSDQPLTLTIVGCAAAWTRRPGGASSCYLVELGDRAIALDFGQGAFAALGAICDPATLDAVLISHLHPDHMIDVVPLRLYLRYGHVPPGHVDIRGPAALGARIDGLTDEPGFLGALAAEPIQPGEMTIGPFAIEVARVSHTDSSHAFRVAPADRPDAAGVVYSGDCGVASDLLPLVRGGDLLLCEASFGVGPKPVGTGHLTAIEAATVARDGRASRLILTHILDQVDREAALAAAAIVFPNVQLAEPGARIVID